MHLIEAIIKPTGLVHVFPGACLSVVMASEVRKRKTSAKGPEDEGSAMRRHKRSDYLTRSSAERREQAFLRAMQSDCIDHYLETIECGEHIMACLRPRQSDCGHESEQGTVCRRRVFQATGKSKRSTVAFSFLALLLHPLGRLSTVSDEVLQETRKLLQGTCEHGLRYVVAFT